MEAQAPAWAHPHNPKTKSAAMAKVEQTLPSPSETPQTICCELSCTVITELDPYSELVALTSPGPFVTILNSGATSHLIEDRGYFVDFAMEDRLLQSSSEDASTPTFFLEPLVIPETILRTLKGLSTNLPF